MDEQKDNELAEILIRATRSDAHRKYRYRKDMRVICAANSEYAPGMKGETPSLSWSS